MPALNERLRLHHEAKSVTMKSMPSQNALCQQILNLLSTLTVNEGGGDMEKTINHSP